MFVMSVTAQKELAGAAQITTVKQDLPQAAKNAQLWMSVMFVTAQKELAGAVKTTTVKQDLPQAV
jgi:hypothetical protein